MTKQITINLTIDEKTAEKLSTVLYKDGPVNQKLLASIFDANNGIEIEKGASSDFFNLIRRFSGREFAHVYAQDSWVEFLLGVALEELANADEDDVNGYLESYDYTGLVDYLMDSHNRTGSYTCNAHKSRAILFDYADQINTEMTDSLSGVSALDEPEKFLVVAMIENMHALFDSLIASYDVDEVETKEAFINLLNEVDPSDLEVF